MPARSLTYLRLAEPQTGQWCPACRAYTAERAVALVIVDGEPDGVTAGGVCRCGWTEYGRESAR